MFPAVQLHQFYSVDFSKETRIIFEDLQLIDVTQLQKALSTNRFTLVEVIPYLFYINTLTQTISIVGHKINESTYFITKEGTGSNFHLPCPYSNDFIQKLIGYLFHIYQNCKSQ